MKLDFLCLGEDIFYTLNVFFQLYCPVAISGISATGQMEAAVDLPPQKSTPCFQQGVYLTLTTHIQNTVCVAVKRYPRSAVLGAHPENIVHGDGISMTSVAGPVGGLQLWPGAIPDRPSVDRPQIDDSLTGTMLK